MLKLLERGIAKIDRRLMLLAPPGARMAPSFRNVSVDPDRRADLVSEMQRLRGAIYLEDGAVQRHQLSRDGLHQTPEDERSWHLLFTNASGRITACAWYLEHPDSASFDRLRVKRCPLGELAGWRETLSRAVDDEIRRARRSGLKYAEVGGWAVSRESRCTSEGLLLALGAYSLGRTLGGALGITTATVRHSSSAILRRLGGSSLEADGRTIPAYYDPNYKCQMELLRFDSRRPDPKYSPLIELLREKLASVPVIASGAISVESHGFQPNSLAPAYA
jgi:hypothetical protein